MLNYAKVKFHLIHYIDLLSGGFSLFCDGLYEKAV